MDTEITVDHFNKDRASNCSKCTSQHGIHEMCTKCIQQQGLVKLLSGRTKHIDNVAKEVFQFLRPKILTTPWFMLFSREVQQEVKKM